MSLAVVTAERAELVRRVVAKTTASGRVVAWKRVTPGNAAVVAVVKGSTRPLLMSLGYLQSHLHLHLHLH